MWEWVRISENAVQKKYIVRYIFMRNRILPEWIPILPLHTLEWELDAHAKETVAEEFSKAAELIEQVEVAIVKQEWEYELGWVLQARSEAETDIPGEIHHC